MKLNPDCIRDILLAVERTTDHEHEMRYAEDDTEDLNYTPREVFYHIDQCEQFGLIRGVRRTLDGAYYIRDLTPAGHEFLANIRSETLWNTTKETAKKVGSFSLDTLTKIAINVVSEAIKRQF